MFVCFRCCFGAVVCILFVCLFLRGGGVFVFSIFHPIQCVASTDVQAVSGGKSHGGACMLVRKKSRCRRWETGVRGGGGMGVGWGGEGRRGGAK